MVVGFILLFVPTSAFDCQGLGAKSASLPEYLVRRGRPFTQARGIEYGPAQGFARNGTAVDGNTAHPPVTLKQGDLLAPFRGVDIALLPRQPASDDQQIVVLMGHNLPFRRFPLVRTLATARRPIHHRRP
jgi:hypothetical protein